MTHENETDILIGRCVIGLKKSRETSRNFALDWLNILMSQDQNVRSYLLSQ